MVYFSLTEWQLTIRGLTWIVTFEGGTVYPVPSYKILNMLPHIIAIDWGHWGWTWVTFKHCLNFDIRQRHAGNNLSVTKATIYFWGCFGMEAVRPKGTRWGWGYWGEGIRPPAHKLSLGSAVSGVQGKAPAEIDLGTFQPCINHLLKAVFVKNDSLESWRCLSNFCLKFPECSNTQNTPTCPIWAPGP